MGVRTKSGARVISQEGAVEAYHRFQRSTELRIMSPDRILHMICGRFVQVAGLRQPANKKERAAVVLKCAPCDVKFNLTIAVYERSV